MSTCPFCTEAVHPGDRFCEACGMVPEPENAHRCTDLAAWLGGCCDIGRGRTGNQDAMALGRAGPEADTAVLVVCDGVTSAPQADRAAVAAAEAALQALLADPRQVRDAVGAADAAASALASGTDDAHANQPACTLALGVLGPGPDGTARIRTANVGDSRAYWLPDDLTEQARHLGSDDSLAAQLIAAGMPAEQAEAGPGAHAITAWLGGDAPDLDPNLDGCEVDGPGWLLVCSDGLWNYFSAPDELRDLVHVAHDALADSTAPAPLAGAGLVPVRAVHVAQHLVTRANEAGGRDNITVALARWAPAGSEGSRP